MCGFAGVVVWDERYRVSRQTLARMGAAVAHRGPDGEGFHLTREHEPITPDAPQVGMAFRRLAILDPDPRSNQPFTDGRRWMVFNGEIYNFRDLRSEISNLDPAYHWRTTGDTEVLLRAYAVWGEKCVEHLNGMFAFAIWDEQDKTLFLARDRMGQKPLYIAAETYEQSGPGKRAWEMGFLAFASEISALQPVPFVSADLEISSIPDYLRWGYSHGSVFQAIRRIGPGCNLTFLRGSPVITGQMNGPYFDPNALAVATDDVSATARVRELVTQAVQRQLVSDVPLGCFLSGGVDSSVIATAARTVGPLETFSIGFDDPRYDESSYAAAVADHLGTRHHAFRVTPKAAEDLPKLAAVFGEPFADSSALPTHYLSRETRPFVKVALSGDGGDELFGGYDRYRAARIAALFDVFPPFVRHVLGGTLGSLLSAGSPKTTSARARRLLKTLGHDPAQRYAGYLRIFDETLVRRLIGEDIHRHIGRREYLEKKWRLSPSSPNPEQWYCRLRKTRDAVRAALATDRVTYLPDDLLTKVDRASMLHGLEVRSPFMDHELVSFAAGLTTDQLLKGGPKRMLREAFAKDLPDFVFKRKKMGFAVPIGEWFRGQLRPMLRDHLFASDSFAKQHFVMPVVQRLVDEHEQMRVDHSQRLYALLMLELWWKTARRQ